jgi:hypothetical protein
VNLLAQRHAIGKWGGDHQDHLRKVITQSARFE